MTNPVLVEIDQAIAVITLNLPEIGNAISDQETVDALVSAFERINRDPSVRVAVLTGKGKIFSAGGNLQKMGEPGELGGGTPPESRTGYRIGIQRIPLVIQTLEVPLIAAVNGAAIGAGCDLACMCDMRIAAQSASFAESFVKVGLIPGDGGAWFLQRIIGFAKAAELTFTGERVKADQALALGLVSRVVPNDELMDAALGLAKTIAANPPQAVRMAKRLMVHARDGQLDTVLEMSAAMQAIAHTTHDHKEAVAAFKEKRSPVFRGD